jgi:hypothetical protein
VVMFFHFPRFNYMNLNFAYSLCGCETWSVILREEHRMRTLENRVLKRILGT